MEIYREFGTTDNIEKRGSQRLDLFFRPLNVADMYFCNLEIIGKKDFNEAKEYQRWLLDIKIPIIKSVIDEAIKKEFEYDEKRYEEHKKKLEDNFKIYENAIRGQLERLDFLKAYT